MFRLTVFCISFICSQKVLGQNNYEFPRHYEYAGVALNIEEQARKIIQNDINSLIVNKNFLKMKFEKMSLFMPIVENILLKNNVPNDFKYLIVQESGMNADVVSSSNAVGYWQFKKESGEKFGLRIDHNIDERKNLQASTKAACKYLKNSQLTLKNWISSLVSYRLGLAGATKNIDPDWNNNSDINIKASSDWYILRSLAYKFVFSQPLPDFQASGNKLVEYSESAGKTIKQIAKETQTDENDIKKLNPWLVSENVPSDKEYIFTLLQKNGDSLLIFEEEKIDENALFVNKKEKSKIEPNIKSDKKKTRIIEIKTESSKAKKKSKVSLFVDSVNKAEIAILKAYNQSQTRPKNNENNDLFLPTGVSKSFQKKTTNLDSPFAKQITLQNSSNNTAFYEISGLLGILAKENDTVKSLAQKGGISTHDFVIFNELNNENDLVIENQIYFLTKKGKKHHAKTHISLSGQTFWDIAQWYGIEEKTLAKNNEHISQGSEIPTASKILLKKKNKTIF